MQLEYFLYKLKGSVDKDYDDWKLIVNYSCDNQGFLILEFQLMTVKTSQASPFNLSFQGLKIGLVCVERLKFKTTF